MKMIKNILPALLLATIAHGRTTFEGEFAPQDGLVSSVEKPYREEICLNGLWEFQGMELPRDWKRNQGVAPELPPAKADGWDDVKIKIPSPWNVNGYQRSDGPDHRDFPSYPDAWEKFKMAWMKKTVAVPADWQGKQLILHFEAVAGQTVVLVSGTEVASNFDLFLPFESDITEWAKPGETVEILVGVRHHSLFNDNSTVGRRIVPAGSMWGQFIAGIWQDVYLFALPKVRVEDVYVKPLVSKGVLELELTLKNDTDQAQSISVGGEVAEWLNQAGESVLEAPVPTWTLGAKALAVPAVSVSVAAGSSKIVTLKVPVKNELKRWNPESPNLYGLTLAVNGGGQALDKKYQRFGWREWTFEGTKMLLNGEVIELRGDSWHFQGIPQMTRRYAWAWFTAIQEANGNAVRPHAQVYPRFYMEMADEMGICVLSETSNWASDGGPRFDSAEFWKHSDEHFKRLILRDRNYPSVFGWSLTNENRPIIMNMFKRPDLMPVQIDAWARWVAQANELDPTRPWISGDGDGDGDGTLPTVVGHYGNENGMKKWASYGKPWGVGEHSMAYYGTPKQVSKYNGERAYESVLGRMEGLAYECYDLIAMQRKHDASYVSVFNIAWYALEPLPLGLSDTSRAPTMEDGVFLTREYVEGKPGIQPERIGPYCTTLNPGYDPALPLFKPWPMFEAIQAANAPGGPAPSEWAEMPVAEAKDAVAPRSTYKKVSFMGRNDARLRARFAARGIDLADQPALRKNSLVLVDGTYAIIEEDAATLKALLAKGGDVLIWGITPQTETAFNQILNDPVEVTDREATSLLVESKAQAVSGMVHSDFYFSEIQKTPVMMHGLAGPFVENGQVVLFACDANWLRWNKVAESIKTAAVLRTEREKKPSGAALVVGQVGKGRVIINTLTKFYQTDLGMEVLKTLFKNMGIPMRPVEMDAGSGIFDLDGKLKKALVCGPFGAESAQAAFDTDFLGSETTIQPLENSMGAGRKWAPASTTSPGGFNFREMGLSGPMDNAAVYVSFWLWSPRHLDDLLSEPDMPNLDFVGGADDAWRVWLNGTLLSEMMRSGPLEMGMIDCKGMPVKQGWNHFLIKVVQGGGNWQFAAQLKCSDYTYMSQLKAALENPDQKK